MSREHIESGSVPRVTRKITHYEPTPVAVDDDSDPRNAGAGYAPMPSRPGE